MDNKQRFPASSTALSSAKTLATCSAAMDGDCEEMLAVLSE